MSNEDISIRLEDGKFEDLYRSGLLVKLLDEVHRRVQGEVPECVVCDAPVKHPIDIDHLEDRYTRSETTDGVSVPVTIRGIKMITRWCRTCSDAVFDNACRALKIVPVTDVKRRLEVTRDDLAATIARREAELKAKYGRYSADRDREGATCGSVFVSRRALRVKKDRNRAAKERHLTGVRSRPPIEGEVTRKSLQDLRKRIRDFERLGVDGVPDADVPKICAKTRELLLASRNMPLRHIAANIKAEALVESGGKVPGGSKFGRTDGSVQ